jgi:hypothetical protein
MAVLAKVGWSRHTNHGVVSVPPAIASARCHRELLAFAAAHAVAAPLAS